MRNGTPAAIALCVGFAGWLVVWAALDRRPPDDHDDFYTHRSIAASFEAEAAPLWALPGVLARHFADGVLHPQLAQTSLVATLGTFGVSRFWLRAANAPWLFVFLFGTFLLARELSGPRLALLAVFIVGTLPIVLNYSRKWDIQFHAACLVPLGLWMAVMALRSGGRWWVAFGLWQGLRAYSHPILVPDIAVTVGLVGVVAVTPSILAGDLKAAARRAAPWLGAAALTGLVAAWYTGWFGALLGEPDYSLRRYIQARQSYTEGVWITEASPLAVVRLAADLVRETYWIHLFPGISLLLLPGLIALPGLVFRRPSRVPDATTLGIHWMLLGTVVAQAPPALLAASNRAYFNDWLFIFPTSVVLALLALREVRWPRAAVRGWVGAVGVCGAWVAVAPVAASLAGPDPIDAPEHYTRGAMDLFTHSTSGRHLVTHHTVVQRRLAHVEVAERARDVVGDGVANLSIGLLDLTWDPSRFGASGCRLGDPAHRAAWRFDRPSESTPGSEPTLSPWPFAFEDFETLDLVTGTSTFDADAMPRLVLVRLWMDPVRTWEEERDLCEPRKRVPEGTIGVARSIARSRLGEQADVVVIEDPTGALVGRTIEWVADPTYLGVALWIDRGAAAGAGTQDDEDV